jgi:hypothetical protein
VLVGCRSREREREVPAKMMLEQVARGRGHLCFFLFYVSLFRASFCDLFFEGSV